MLYIYLIILTASSIYIEANKFCRGGSLRAPYSFKLVQEPITAVEFYVSSNPFLPLEEQHGSYKAFVL